MKLSLYGRTEDKFEKIQSYNSIEFGVMGQAEG